VGRGGAAWCRQPAQKIPPPRRLRLLPPGCGGTPGRRSVGLTGRRRAALRDVRRELRSGAGGRPPLPPARCRPPRRSLRRVQRAVRALVPLRPPDPRQDGPGASPARMRLGARLWRSLLAGAIAVVIVTAAARGHATVRRVAERGPPTLVVGGVFTLVSPPIMMVNGL